MSDPKLNQFIQLFILIDTAPAQRIAERLALVLSNPAAYQEQFAEELEERGIVAALPEQELRDLALLDALLSKDLAWESDWQETAGEIAEGLNQILTQQKREQRLRPAALVSRREPGPEQLDTVQDALEALGLALVLFPLDSDAYPLGVVADAQAKQLRQLAHELGFGITVY